MYVCMCLERHCDDLQLFLLQECKKKVKERKCYVRVAKTNKKMKEEMRWGRF